MPLILDTTSGGVSVKSGSKNSVKSAYNVKYFSPDLTGTGKNIGLINASMNPANLPPLMSATSNTLAKKIKKEIYNGVKTVMYPIDPLAFFNRAGTKRNALKQVTCKLAEDAANNTKLFVEFTPVAIGISEPMASTAQNLASPAPIPRKLLVDYRIDFIEEEIVNGAPEYFVLEEIYTRNPSVAMSSKIQNGIITTGIAGFKTKSYKIDSAHKANYDNYLNGYDLYNELNEVSKVWQTTITDDIIATYDANPTYFPMRDICKYIGTYKISMSQYGRFYQELIKRFPESEIKTFTQVNTYLLLQDTMENLKQTQFVPLADPANIPNYKSPDFSWCSKEQLTAVTSSAPLNLVQAGAGTGKSTTIKARIEYLLSVGVKPEDILVLSFTNAAADNMKEKAPNIQSMTIAKMIDEIYTLQHPTHKLASAAARKGEGSTFTNSLSMYKDTNPLAERLINAAYRAEVDNDYVTILRLVEEEYAGVIDLLDQVEQTTFQLQIILTYHEHHKLTIPFSIKHLVIDEVQDNAVFEFIFFLNLTCKLANHVYLVGDCSQTLYEFRASDPKALSVVENSGIFKTYPLNINYRSNQAILSYANTLLNDIEANQNAHIQLRSFKLSQTTQQDFRDTVTVDYEKLNKATDMQESVERRIRMNVKPWIDARLNKKEQICFLSFSRRENAIMMKLIEQLYPNAAIVNISPAKNISFAYFSKYVSSCEAKLKALPLTSGKDLCKQVRADIIANLTTCNIDPTKPQYPLIFSKVSALIDGWERAYIGVLDDCLKQLAAGRFTHDELVKTVGDSLIDYEIQQNALKQTISSQRNAARKTNENVQKADFVFSTIHSAKGLEFDHVVLLYKNQNDMKEDEKRMYYVAMTRAKKSEYIIGYGTVVKALLLSRYDSVIQRLPVSVTLSAGGQVASVTNTDGSVIKADGTGYDTKGNTIDSDGKITLADGTVLEPDENGAIDLSSKP